MKKVKFTKRQLKEDEFVQATFKATTFIQDHWKTIATAVIAVAIIMGGITLYNHHQTRTNREASSLFFQAYLDFQEENIDSAREGFKEVSDEYGSTSYGKEAALHLANIAYQNGAYDDAKNYFKKCIRNYPADHLFAISAHEGIAACLEAEGKFDEAAESYLKIADKHKDAMIATRNLLAAARAYEAADKYDSAASACQRIVDNYPESPDKATAETKISSYKFFAQQ